MGQGPELRDPDQTTKDRYLSPSKNRWRSGSRPGQAAPTKLQVSLIIIMQPRGREQGTTSITRFCWYVAVKGLVLSTTHVDCAATQVFRQRFGTTAIEARSFLRVFSLCTLPVLRSLPPPSDQHYCYPCKWWVSRLLVTPVC